ncbi:MAG: hypothetical protein ABIH89_06950 [Elusimicrobiota bacterium]
MKDRRKYIRNEINAVADVFDDRSRLIHRGEVSNVSPEGFVIMISDPMEVGTKIICNILQRESMKIRILIENATAEVVRLEEKGAVWLHALIFKDIRLEDKLQLGHVES